MTTQGKHGADAGTEELREDVDRARHDLGETVEQLAAKADVKAMAREKAEYARGRARDAAASAWQIAGSEKARTRTQQGGAVIVSAGAVAMAAVWMRRRRSPKARLGRGRNAPMPVRFRAGRKRTGRMRRRRRMF